MRLTCVLNRQNVYRSLKAHWNKMAKIKLRSTTTEQVVKSHGFEVVNIKDVLNPRKKIEQWPVVGLYDRELPLDENHPTYSSVPCHKFCDDNVLLEGLQQAKVLTNTVEISQDLENILEDLEKRINLPADIHKELQKRIKLSCALEATQEKLPKRKDPLRPAWNFPRDFGIPDSRLNELLCKNLLTFCEQLSENLREKSVVENAFFSVPIEAHNKKIKLELLSELAVTSRKKIKPLAEPSATHSVSLPNIHPIDCTVGLNPVHFYDMEDIYPLKVESKWPYVHLSFVHFNPSQVKNLYAEEVTEEQIFGRTLMKGFCISASQARALYGKDVKVLPEPIVVPLIHTSGKNFYFGIYQLNTLEIDKNTELKNIFWNSPTISLYDMCQYKSGRPVLEGYNPKVISKVLSLYSIK